MDGEYYLACQVGSQNQEFKAWLTTSEHDFGLITTDCGACYTDDKYVLGSSTSMKDSGMVESESMVLFM